MKLIADVAKLQVGPSVGRYLWFFVPDDVPSRFSGVVPEIGDTRGFVFKNFEGAIGGQTMADSYAVLAHELGHALGLFHPDDDRIGNQLPNHLKASLGQPVNAEPVTNTEPAIIPTP